MKAYFRRAEVLAAAGQYDLSLLLYGRALQLQPNDMAILHAAKRAAAMSSRETMCKQTFYFEFLTFLVIRSMI